MDRKKHFEKYYSRFMWEGIIKSTMYGLSVGLALGFISALVTWFMAFNGFWLSIGIIVVGSLVTVPIFYFKLFRPTVVSNARRIDRYGLEERLVTMVDYEEDSSCIAELQRRDAAEKLAEIEANQIKIKISKLAIILLAVAVVLGGGMTAVNGLATIGVLPGGIEFVDSITPDPEPVYIEVIYMVLDGGVIEGDEVQVIESGGRTDQVVAVPDEGYAFAFWNDGSEKPVRIDAGLEEDAVFVAVFVPLDENGEGDGDDPGSPGEADKPGKYDGQGSSPSGKPGSSSGPSEDMECNQVIDGETYYGSVYEEYLDGTLEDLTSNAEMPGDVKDFVSSYYKIIQSSDEESEEDDDE